MTTDVDVAVVGRGMIGSAAARHLAESGAAVALIGPGEPPDRRASHGPFSSHGDEGRITRIAARTEAWAVVAARSIRRYPDIEERSGIGFHTPSGLVSVFEAADDWVARGRAVGSDARLVDTDWVRQRTGIVLTNDLPAMYEGAPAGHINPRRLVAAQTALTAAAGGTVVDQAASTVEPAAGGFRVAGGWGSVTAGRVLIATGAFGSALVPAPLLIDRRPRTILMAELTGDIDLRAIPSLICDRPPDDRLQEIYWVPPVPYPDGVARLKIGGNLRAFTPLTPDDLVDWFHSDGSDVEVDALEVSLRGLLPDAEIVSIDRAPCVITGTPTGHPYIGWIDDGIAVAIAGNGSAAKSSDELGRLAATLFDEDGWTDDLDAALFRPQLAEP